MADLDVNEPDDNDVASQFPANERAHRAAALALFNGVATWGGTSGGAANAQTVTISNTGWTLTAGATVDFIAGFANSTTTPTLQVNATTAKTIVTPSNGALVASDIVASRLHTVRYDGTSWRLLNPALSGAVSQTLYDALFPVGFVQLRDDETAVALPTGITATWTRISTTSYLRGSTSTTGTGGSLTTGGSGTLTTNATANTTQVDHDASEAPNAAHGDHLHTIDSHTHTIEPTYRSFVIWERTA